MSPSVRVLLYFYRAWFLPSSGWVMLHLFSVVGFLKPSANPYEEWKYKFVCSGGHDNMSPFITGELGGPLFPLSWTPYPKFTVMVDSRVLYPLDYEVIQVLKCFHPLESSILIVQDREDNHRVEEVDEYIDKGNYNTPDYFQDH